jgi:hypothetical protein
MSTGQRSPTRIGGLLGNSDQRGRAAGETARGRQVSTDFGELYFQPEPAGQRRFVWRVPVDWPVPEDEFDLGRVSDTDAFWLHVAIWACLPQSRPASVDVADSAGRLLSAHAANFIYKTNAERSRKARVHFQPVGEPEGTERFLTLEARRTRGPSVCPNCHPSLSAFVPFSAPHCAGCGASADERQEFTGRLYAELRKLAGVR